MVYYFGQTYVTAGDLNITPPDPGISVAVILINNGAATVKITLADAGKGATLPGIPLQPGTGVVLDNMAAEIVQNVSVDVAGSLFVGLYEQILKRNTNE